MEHDQTREWSDIGGCGCIRRRTPEIEANKCCIAAYNCIPGSVILLNLDALFTEVDNSECAKIYPVTGIFIKLFP